ncbi:nucleotide exchange factor GrpE [Erysipelotrichaceae bacterium OttesenSCG-928-M19]|nr:nucleotide exchange factor GrpE [Erysipelotrichaceae bacterium OttesenSCG-928-M19]
MSKKKIKDEVVEEELVEEELVEDVVEELSEVEKLQQDINELKEINKDLENKYYVAYADAQNMIKRAKIDSENLVINKISKIVEEILPALDNFERALMVQVADENLNNFLKGFKMVYDQLYLALENEGVSQIESVGKEFDPNYHEAIAQVKDDNYASNIIVEEVAKGYIFRNRVIRPAMVKVNE